MKKRVLRKWVVYLLTILTTIEFTLLTGEFASLLVQGIFILICGFCGYMNVKIVKKWGFVERWLD